MDVGVLVTVGVLLGVDVLVGVRVRDGVGVLLGVLVGKGVKLGVGVRISVRCSSASARISLGTALLGRSNKSCQESAALPGSSRFSKLNPRQ